MEPAEVVAFPRRGEVFVDQRGGARALRLAWHPEAGVAVLSVWQADRCTASFRLPISDVPALVHALAAGLAGLAGETERGPHTAIASGG